MDNAQRLESIGFYTLSDERARRASDPHAPMSRCELLVTSRCNFKCPYCRPMCHGDIPLTQALEVLRLWTDDHLENLRFSGGEPTLYRDLPLLVKYAKKKGVQRIAVSTNGSASKRIYEDLIGAGVDDWSISLDACCAQDSSRLSGVAARVFDTVVENIMWMAKVSYLTIGTVITEANEVQVGRIILLANQLGVSDIRVIPAAQYSKTLRDINLPDWLINAHPILRYRVERARAGHPVRGLRPGDPDHCYLVRDDSAVQGGYHYPCIIYLRENGDPIGTVGSNMRAERWDWHRGHNPHHDPICQANCLDVCVDMNKKCRDMEASR